MNQNHKYEPVSVVWLVVAAILLVAFVWKIAEAGGKCNGNHNCSDTIVDTTVNAGSSLDNTTNIAGDSSRAYGFGLGDVDINDCYRSYQVLIWQDSKINKLCLADSYDQKGLHDMAAKIRCDVRTIRKHFKTNKKCEDANTMQTIEPSTSEVTKTPSFDDIQNLYTRAAQYDEDEEERDDRVEQIEQRIDQWEQRANNYAVSERERKDKRLALADRLEGK